MLRRTIVTLGILLAVLPITAATAQAQVRQSVSFNLGYLASPPEDVRPTTDVLVQNMNFLLFNLSDFSGASVSGDYLIGFGQYVEAGVGVGYHRRTVPSVYADYVDSDGSEINQDLKLSVTPVAFTVRFLPLGQQKPIQPYVGAGVGIYHWRYAETGEFVDFNDGSIFRGSYVDSGNEVGAVYLGGVRFPVGDTFTAGLEVQFHDGTGNLNPSLAYAGSTVELGGWLTQVTFRLKF